MLNPDGKLWLDRSKSGLEDAGAGLSLEDGERIVRLVVDHVGAEVHAGAAHVSAEPPETGDRFEGLLPPVVAAPTFAIRKPAVAVFTLDDYVASGVIAKEHFACLLLAYRGPSRRPSKQKRPRRTVFKLLCFFGLFGAPRSMKMGNIATPWRHDGGAYHAFPPPSLRWSAIAH
jgi:hypothetical protein